MRSDRIVLYALALALLAPASAIAQTTPVPEPEDASGTPETVPPETAATGAAEVEVEAEAEAEAEVEAEAEAAAIETVVATDPAPKAAPVGEHPEETVAIEPEPQPDVTTPAPVGISWNRKGDNGTDYPWSLLVGGYIRVGYVGIENDASGTFGRHDGFGLANARLALDGTMRSLGFEFQLDGAVDQFEAANDPVATVHTRIRDANLFWQPLDFLRVSAGQFKVPFDVEEQISTSRLLFANRSVGSRGVGNIEGRNVDGLSFDRQVGLMVGSDPFYLLADGDEPSGPGVSYGIAVTNGQSGSRALNDNDKFAGYGRAALHWGEYVSVGGAYAINPRTIGVDPDTLEEDLNAWTADIVVDVVGFTAIGSIIGASVTRPDLDGAEPETSALAYQGQLAYREPFLGFQPAVRYAYFDPAERADESDALTHLTFGLNYLPPYPVRLQLNYTVAQETEELSLANNRFDAVLQVTW